MPGDFPAAPTEITVDSEVYTRVALGLPILCLFFFLVIAVRNLVLYGCASRAGRHVSATRLQRRGTQNERQ
jgi:hypothetical protein